MQQAANDPIDLSPQVDKILTALKGASRPLSAYDILDKVRRTGIKSPPTVYRALEKLNALGLIHRLESLNAYIACCQHNQSACAHEHGHAHNHVSPFAICTACGAVKELVASGLAKFTQTADNSFLKRVDKTVLELYGICHECAKQD